MKNFISNPLFWFGAAERAVKTFAQALIALIGTQAVAIHSLDWVTLLATAGTAALLSLLTSIATPGAATVAPSDGSTDTISRFRGE